MKYTLIIALYLTTTTLHAHNLKSSRADAHAPISVMGDHTHGTGEWMFSYRYMKMSMSGLNQGNDSISLEQVLNDFMVAPVEMDMDMHMFGVMYAPTNRITLMAMLNYLDNDMLIENRMGNRFSTASSGLGDSKFSALVKLKQWGGKQSNRHKLHANLGVSLPTGSINPRDNTPMGTNSLLPYPMRLGSGTYDINLGLTWNYQADKFSMGAQIMNTTRTGENDEGYRLGHENKLTYWLAKPLTPAWSVGLTLEAKNVQSIKGRDNRIMNPMMAPTVNADFSGGDFVNIGVGLNYLSNQDNWTHGHRLAIEYTEPVVQDVSGIQMNRDAMFTIGWQKAF